MNFIVTLGIAVTDELLADCVRLFSENYGIWSPDRPRPGGAVKLGASKIRQLVLGDPETALLVTCHMGDRLVGHAFPTSWEYAGVYDKDRYCWMDYPTRVHRDWRKRHIATRLLQTLANDPAFSKPSVFGLVSSHPAACNALANMGHVAMDRINTEFIAKNARAILASTTVEYLKTAVLRGSLFEENAPPGVISSVFTDFFVDHGEPLLVLNGYRSLSKWCLGELLEGHEIFIAVERSQSRSQAAASNV